MQTGNSGQVGQEKQLHANKSDNFDEMDQSLQRHERPSSRRRNRQPGTWTKTIQPPPKKRKRKPSLPDRLPSESSPPPKEDLTPVPAAPRLPAAKTTARGQLTGPPSTVLSPRAQLLKTPAEQSWQHVRTITPGFLWEHRLVQHREPHQQNKEIILIEAEGLITPSHIPGKNS